ncbi:hypothetical protein HELRODRAFT_162762 [Helobdella robusta]|uniref:Uncharacterized protein n=1 Tax=Helobdella robusta TaxID=6412 RepID=T1ET36_HELRO|nr:hypothetical protein HELRODRAFT_162762 [Helobdella robusta]ESN99244.1 hypothetical protein HELRODRAFT_162762 [Helobdella robusta]
MALSKMISRSHFSTTYRGAAGRLYAPGLRLKGDLRLKEPRSSLSGSIDYGKTHIFNLLLTDGDGQDDLTIYENNVNSRRIVMTMSHKPYRLRCTLFGHEKDVRGLCSLYHPPSSFISVSRDITARVWVSDE